MVTTCPDRARAAAAPQLRGRAAREVAALGDRVVWCDLYDERGSVVYHDTGALDGSEIRELSRLLRRRRGPVLELAAGSGRLTLPMLSSGRPVTAVELSPSMVGLLRAAAAGARHADRLDVVCADMTDVDLGRRFPTIVLGASSVTLLRPDQRPRLYATVDRHLDDGGTFLLSLAEPCPASGGTCDESYDLVGRSGTRYRLHQYWQPGDAHRTVCVHPADGSDAEVPVCLSTPLVLDSGVLAAELAAAGLRVVAEHRVADRGGAVRDVIWEVRR